MQFTWSKECKSTYLKLSRKLQERTNERLELFAADPFHPMLNNHKLVGSYAGYRSINLTGDYRLVFEQVDETTVFLCVIGTHSQLYE